MLKRRLTLYLAGSGGIFTVLVGLLQEVDITIILFRAIVSMVIFGVCGFMFGSLAESFLREMLVKFNAKGKNVDITDEDQATSGVDDPENKINTDQQFRPFTTDNFDRVAGS